MILGKIGYAVQHSNSGNGCHFTIRMICDRETFH